MHFSDIFRQENQRFPVAFESANWSIRSIIQQFSLTVNSTKTIVFLVLRIRCQMGKWFEFVAFQKQKIALKEVFRRRQSVSFHFLGQKMRRKRLKTTVFQRSWVGQHKEMRFFSGVFHLFAQIKRVVIGDSPSECSYSQAFSRICRSIIVRNMVCIPILIVIYTVNHLDIYIYRKVLF